MSPVSSKPGPASGPSEGSYAASFPARAVVLLGPEERERDCGRQRNDHEPLDPSLIGAPSGDRATCRTSLGKDGVVVMSREPVVHARAGQR